MSSRLARLNAHSGRKRFGDLSSVFVFEKEGRVMFGKFLEMVEEVFWSIVWLPSGGADSLEERGLGGV